MNQDPKMQELHDRATKGAALLPLEQKVLQNWYTQADDAENELLNQTNNNPDLQKLREDLRTTLAAVSKATIIVEEISSQNELLRKENESIRRAVEKHLLDQAA